MASGDARPVPQKNVAYRVTFPIYDVNGDLVASAAGLDSEISKDGGTFADCTNEATQIATTSGVYYLDLTATEMNADTVTIKVKSTTTDSKDTVIVLYPEEADDIRVNVTRWSSAAVNALVSGRVDASVGAMANAVLTAAAIATDAITAAKIAANALGASELAADAVNEIRDAILTDATKFPGASITEARLAELDAGNLPTDIANVETDTQNIQSRLPAALVGGRMDANASAINNVANAAVRLALSAAQMIPGTVDTATFTPTTTQFEADDITEATADHFNKRVVLWTTGNLAGQAAVVEDYELANSKGKFTVPAMTEAPANNDTFIVI